MSMGCISCIMQCDEAQLVGSVLRIATEIELLANGNTVVAYSQVEAVVYSTRRSV